MSNDLNICTMFICNLIHKIGMKFTVLATTEKQNWKMQTHCESNKMPPLFNKLTHAVVVPTSFTVLYSLFVGYFPPSNIAESKLPINKLFGLFHSIINLIVKTHTKNYTHKMHESNLHKTIISIMVDIFGGYSFWMCDTENINATIAIAASFFSFP